MMSVREIPSGSNINGRPILDNKPGVRHLAFYRDGYWWTWCYEQVPRDHQCPSDEEVANHPPYVQKNCADCDMNYRALNGQPWTKIPEKIETGYRRQA